MRTLDFKADRHELVIASQTRDTEHSFDRSELEKLFSILKQATIETDEKFAVLEARVGDQAREIVGAVEKIKNELVLALQQKPEFQDLETMANKINTKADF